MQEPGPPGHGPVPAPAVSRMEHGEEQPDAELLERLDRVLAERRPGAEGRALAAWYIRRTQQ